MFGRRITSCTSSYWVWSVWENQRLEYPNAMSDLRLIIHRVVDGHDDSHSPSSGRRAEASQWILTRMQRYGSLEQARQEDLRWMAEMLFGHWLSRTAESAAH
jgi:hypothetical protein